MNTMRPIALRYSDYATNPRPLKAKIGEHENFVFWAPFKKIFFSPITTPQA
jgi:hypothetical protein